MRVVRCRVVVSGRVQGVFYRDSCRAAAERIGVRGSVRNLADGSVEVVAEGPRDKVGEFLEWCRDGPPRAHVTGMTIVDEPPQAERGFHIRY